VTVEPQFAIEDIICKLGKVSINLELEGDDEVVVFCIPITGAVIDADTANAIAGDPYFTRSVYNDNKGFLEPMSWVRKAISFPEKYENAVACITLPGDDVLEYHGARIKDVELTPTPGGMTGVDFQLQIRPELDRGNLLLQEYQHREVTICIADAKIQLKKQGKQKELPLQQPDEQQELARSSEAELEAARQRDETERQLGEALRGLDAQQPVEQVAAEGEGDAANDSEGDSESSSESEQPARARRGRKGEHSRAH
jgi:hypothetical protein